MGADMSGKTLDLSGAVPYHMGAFPPAALDYEALLGPLDEAASALARYDAKMSAMVNSALLVAPLRRQDAVSSSRMEGTISTIEQVYRIEADAEGLETAGLSDQRNDDIETLLYSSALQSAYQTMVEGAPLSEHLIRTAHQQLLSFGRGARKRPGAYKTEQNFIGDGRRGQVFYVPIAPEHLAPAMAELISFINHGAMRPLLRAALAHVEFEALHPFEDGNGRIGRMLITLMLWHHGVISQPNFFVSGYFEKHKDEYIGRMRAVSSAGDWTSWCVFFLNAMKVQAEANLQTVQNIAKLYIEMKEEFRRILNSQYYDKALDFVFDRPIFRNDRFVELGCMPASSARLFSKRLVEAGLLRTVQPAAGRRAALYAFDPLLELIAI